MLSLPSYPGHELKMKSQVALEELDAADALPALLLRLKESALQWTTQQEHVASLGKYSSVLLGLATPRGQLERKEPACQRSLDQIQRIKV